MHFILSLAEYKLKRLKDKWLDRNILKRCLKRSFCVVMRKIKHFLMSVIYQTEISCDKTKRVLYTADQQKLYPKQLRTEKILKRVETSFK